MKLLLTSDWQADWSNLGECSQSLDELLAAADKYKVDAVIHAGDFKHKYDALPVSVVNFAVHATSKIIKAGYRFIVLLGNHDRVSQSVDAKDWFPVLRAAGAETVTKPKWNDIGNGTVGFIPFTQDKQQERKWAKALADDAALIKRPAILILHAEIADATMNAAGIQTKGNTPDDLYFNYWDAVFSGHIHKHQRITDNSWYIGSPFTQDWGEVDVAKGHLYVEV